MKLNRDLNPDQYDEDDVFYADLRRLILILTADEDEDEDEHLLEWKHSNSFNLNATKSSSLHGLTSSSSVSQPTGSYFSWWESWNTNSVPTWLVNFWKNDNGPGVLILHIVKSGIYKPGKPRIRELKHSGNWEPDATIHHLNLYQIKFSQTFTIGSS